MSIRNVEDSKLILNILGKIQSDMANIMTDVSLIKSDISATKVEVANLFAHQSVTDLRIERIEKRLELVN